MRLGVTRFSEKNAGARGVRLLIARCTGARGRAGLLRGAHGYATLIFLEEPSNACLMRVDREVAGLQALTPR